MESVPRPASLDAVGAISALEDPVRRALYDHVSAATDGATREDAAAAAGVSRSLAAYHLDRLADEGLLTVRYERRTGRTGPGAGRPAKVYSRAEEEIRASVPPRDYALLARLLADAAAHDTQGGTRAALREAAGRLGRQMAAEASADPVTRLRERGYEPRESGDGCLCLANCPFHAAAREHPEVVCDMNLALLRGMVGEELEPVLDPAPGRCCVTLRPR